MGGAACHERKRDGLCLGGGTSWCLSRCLSRTEQDITNKTCSRQIGLHSNYTVQAMPISQPPKGGGGWERFSLYSLLLLFFLQCIIIFREMSWFPVLQCREEHNIQPRWGKCGFGSCHRRFFKMIIYRCLILDISLLFFWFYFKFSIKYTLCGVPFKYIYTPGLHT